MAKGGLPWLYYFFFMFDFHRTAKGGLQIFTVRPRGVCGTFFHGKIPKKHSRKSFFTRSPPLRFRSVNFGFQGTPQGLLGSPGLQTSGNVFFQSVNLGPQGTPGGLLGTPGI